MKTSAALDTISTATDTIGAVVATAKDFTAKLDAARGNPAALDALAESIRGAVDSIARRAPRAFSADLDAIAAKAENAAAAAAASLAELSAMTLAAAAAALADSADTHGLAGLAAEVARARTP